MNRFLDLSAAKYHADAIGHDVPSLSNSIANEMLMRSPWHARRLHPRLGGKSRKPTPPQGKGTLLHALMLGADDAYKIIDVDDFRTKDAQRARDDAEAAGLHVVKAKDLPREMERAARIDGILRRDYGIVLGAMKRELTAVWHERTDIIGHEPTNVLCRARFDAFDGTTIYDLKTCADGAPSSFARSVLKYGYHVQCAAYTSAVETIEPRLADRTKFVIIAIENETDAVYPIELDGTFRELGRRRWQTAVNAWHQCLTSGKWPGYGGGEPVYLECPEWAKVASDTECASLRGKVDL